MQNKPTITVSLATSQDVLSFTRSQGALLIVSARDGLVCHCLPGSKGACAKVAAYVATLPADDQLDTLEAIRAAGRLVSPLHVSEKDTLELYPDVAIKI